MDKKLKSNILIITSSFFLGAFITYFSIDYIQIKRKSSRLPNSVTAINKDLSDSFLDADEIHEQMQKRMRKLFGDNIFDDDFINSDSFSFSNEKVLSLKQYEDNRYKYIDVSAEGLKPDEINVEVAAGMVRIYGELKQEDKVENENSKSFSSFISKFSQSFSVPSDVDGNKIEIEKKENVITIRFPKSVL